MMLTPNLEKMGEDGVMARKDAKTRHLSAGLKAGMEDDV